MRPFPEGLGRRFDEAALTARPSSVAIIDRPGSILWVNPAWHRFAEENGAAGSSHQWRSYFEGIAPPLRAYFETAFGDALDRGQVFQLEYECSSPEQQRRFHLRALPVGGNTLVLEHALVFDAPHDADPLALALERYVEPSGFIAQCSNCRRVRDPESRAFHWVPMFVQRVPAETTHVICPSCADYYYPRRGPVER
ncbi:MAG TPA: PAS domain-containing protein [Polyangiaceae bacterium]|nr:PAS domain-containing protein [Polyangiaceae bacterium]